VTKIKAKTAKMCLNNQLWDTGWDESSFMY